MWWTIVVVSLLAISKPTLAQTPEQNVNCGSALSYAFFPSVDDCSRFVFCKDGAAEDYQCHEGEIWSQTDGACVLGDKETCQPWTPDIACSDGEEERLVAYPRNCGKFIWCGADAVEVRDCEPGMVFSELDAKCIIGRLDTCESLEHVCDEEGTDDQRHPNRCDIAIVCDENEATLKRCPEGDIFVEELRICVPGSLETCQLLPVEEMCVDRADQTLMHPDRCQSYVQCVNGTSKEKDCSRGMIFDPWDMTCVVGKIVNENSCEKLDQICANTVDGDLREHSEGVCDIYIKCMENEIPQINSCIYGTIWSQDWMQCVPGNRNTCQPSPIATICNNQPYGSMFPHPDDCSKLVQCNITNTNEIPCPPDHIVQPITLDCILGDPTTCESLDDMCRNHADEIIVLPNDCERYVHCVNGLPNLINCEPGNIFDETQRECVPGNSVSCEPLGCIEGFSRHPNYCDIFVNCDDDGQISTDVCPNQHIWHQHMRRCTPGSVTDCTYDTLETMCTGRNNATVFPYPSEENRCDASVLCVDGDARVQNCPLGMVVRPEHLDCVPGNDRTCRIFDLVCTAEEEEWVEIHPTRCNIRILCRLGVLTVVECPEGQIVDEELLICKPGVCTEPSPEDEICFGLPDNSLLPDLDAENCVGYYECQNELPIGSSCPEGTIFNRQDMECVPGIVSECEDLRDYCRGKPNGIMPFPEVGKCNLYLECVDENTSANSCPSGDIFLETVGVCIPGSTTDCERLPLESMCAGRDNDLIYPHPEDCSNYVVCQDGTAMPYSCPRGDIFNAIDKQCFAGDSCTLFEGCSDEPDGTKLEHPTDSCDLYVECANGRGNARECPAGQIVTSETNFECVPGDVSTCMVSPIDELCAGQVDGAQFPHSENCDEYYRCTNEVASNQRCPEGTIFLESESNCVAGVAEAGDGSTCIDLRSRCTDKEDGLIALSERCDWFISCTAGETTVQPCASDEIFPEDGVGVCIPGSATDCQPFPLDRMCVGRVDATIYPHPSDCSQFVSCQNEEPIEEPCERGNIFSPIQQRCSAGIDCQPFNDCAEEGDSAKLPYPVESECDLYVECTLGQGTAHQCPLGQIFVDRADGECVPGDVETCVKSSVDELCAGQPDGTLAALPESENCVDHYRCENEVRISQSCADGTIFLADEKECVPGTSQEDSGCTDLRDRCQDSADVLLPFPDRCDLLLACSDRQTTVHFCEPGEIFVEGNQICVSGNVEECTASGDANQFCEGLSDGQYPHPLMKLCYLYVECTGGELTVSTCPVDEVFDADSNGCILGDRNNC